MPLSSSRGAGKVLPRRRKEASGNSIACTALLANIADASSVNSSSSEGPTPTNPATSSGDAPRQQPGMDSLVATQVPLLNTLPWRCHPMFQSAQQQLPNIPPGKLHLGSSRRLLRTGCPLLLPSSHLVNIPHPSATQPASSPTSATGGQGHTLAPPPGSVLLMSLPATKTQQPKVLSSPQAANVFLDPDPAKNLPGSYYHVRRPETGRLHLAAAEALQCSSTWTKTRLYVKGLLAEWQIKQQPSQRGSMLEHGATVCSTSSGIAQAPPPPAAAAAAAAAAPPATNIAASSSHLHLLVDGTTLAAVSQAVSATTAAQASAAVPQPQPCNTPTTHATHLLDPAALAHLVAAGGWAPSGQLEFDFGQTDALLPARYQLQDQVVCQVTGSRRVLLVAPADGLRGLYPYPVAHPYDMYSCVDLESPELEHWRRAGQVQGMVCDLRPGDALVVPGGWWVHTQLLQPNSCAVALQLHPGPARVTTKGALLLQLSRCIEAWTAGAVGAANTRSQLMAVAEGREWHGMRLMTRKGVHKLELTALVLRQLQQVLALPDEQPGEGRLMGLLRRRAAGDDMASCQQQEQLLELQPSQHHHHHHQQEQQQHNQQQQLLLAPVGIAPQVDMEQLARRFLELMCEERLIPTTWLDEGIQDPLYLQHPPRHYLLLEDQEASRYQQLFRHRLKGACADWQAHAQPVALLAGRAVQQQGQLLGRAAEGHGHPEQQELPQLVGGGVEGDVGSQLHAGERVLLGPGAATPAGQRGGADMQCA